LDTTSLDKLVAWKASLDISDDDTADRIQSVRTEILLDISKRYPWSFLERKSESITLSSGDYHKELPPDFLRIIGVGIFSTTDNVVYPVHSERAGNWEEGNPDEDDTDQPYFYWLEWHSITGKPWIALRPKSDSSLTLRIRYQKKLLADQVPFIPNGLVPFFGMMSVLISDADKMNLYKSLYEAGIEQMWISDMPDLNDAPDLKPDRAIEIFNEYMDSLL
jgi:hypothetical protein